MTELVLNVAQYLDIVERQGRGEGSLQMYLLGDIFVLAFVMKFSGWYLNLFKIN